MSEFIREQRYIVIKLKDLNERQYGILRDVLVGEKINEREAVVVESTNPLYEDVWEMIEDEYYAD